MTRDEKFVLATMMTQAWNLYDRPMYGDFEKARNRLIKKGYVQVNRVVRHGIVRRNDYELTAKGSKAAAAVVLNGEVRSRPMVTVRGKYNTGSTYLYDLYGRRIYE